MAASDCADVLAGMFRRRGRLSEREIRTIIEEFQRRGAGRQGGLNFDDPDFRRIAEEIAREVREAAHVERLRTNLRIAVKQRADSLADHFDEKFDDPALAIRAMDVGTNQPAPGNRISVGALQETLPAKYGGMFVADLERENLLPHLNTGYLDLEIMRAKEKITKPTAAGSNNEFANKIAEIWHRHDMLRLNEMNRWGAWRKPKKGFIFSQGHSFHDAHKLETIGLDEWRSDMLNWLDHGETFGDKNPQIFLQEAYRTLVNEEKLSGDGSIDLELEFRGAAGLGKRLSRHRVLHFKDADSAYAYMQKYGSRSLREAMLTDISADARAISMLQVWGPTPEQTRAEVIQQLKRKYSDEPAKVKRLNSAVHERNWAVISGQASQPYNRKWARLSHDIGALKNMSSLGTVIASTITDIPAKAAAIRYATGDGILSAWAKALESSFRSVPSYQRAKVGDLSGYYISGLQYDLAERFGAEDTRAGVLSRWQRTFFKLNLLTPWTNHHKRAMGDLLDGIMASHATATFDALPTQMKYVLSQYGIDAPRWELMRTNLVRMADDNRLYMLPSEMQFVPNEEFMRRGLDPATDRDAIENALRVYYMDFVNMGVPTPGPRERAILTWGFQDGTVEGMAVRRAMQFKGYPVTIGTRLWGRLRYANPDGSADKMGLAAYIAATIVLGYAAMSLKNLAKGQTPRDPLDYKTWIAAMAQGGGAGIYGDFLFGETNRFGRSILDTMAGPTFSTVADLHELWTRARNGDDLAGQALRLAMNNAPFVNLFYTRAAMDYLILYNLQEMANPGYLRRMEKRIQKEQGQTFILPRPSSVIPRGGGQLIGEGFM